jgi:phenylacetate-CoA ligase
MPTIPAKLGSLMLDAWRAERGGAAAVAARQQRRLADLVRFARARSPFYRALYQDLPADGVDLRQLPPVTKTQLMSRFDDWVTDPAVTRASVGGFLADRSLVGQRYLGRYVMMTTSGISGERAVLLHDAHGVAVYRALTLLRGWLPRMSLTGLWPTVRQGNRLAALVTGGGHYGGVTIFEAARRDHPWPFDRIRVLSVVRPLADLVVELNAFQPAQLIGYPTALALLAEEQRAGRLGIGPAVVGSGGDWLSPPLRHQIEVAFRCPVRQNYGASEFPPLAWDCRRGELHVSADWAILEPVDAAYRSVLPGHASSSVLLTNLANRVQPMIRYDLGDTVVLGAEPCACGSRLPTVRVAGRREEILTLRTPAGRMVALQPNAVARLAVETPGVRLVQIVQTGAAALGLRLEPVPGEDHSQVWDRLAQRLRDFLVAHGLSDVSLARLPEPPERDPVSGKLRRVVVDPALRRRER